MNTNLQRVSLIVNNKNDNSSFKQPALTAIKSMTRVKPIYRGPTPKKFVTTSPAPPIILHDKQKVSIQIPKPNSQPNVADVKSYFRNVNTPLPNLTLDEYFDELADFLQSKPVNEATESFGIKVFKADKAILWIIQEGGYFSPSYKITIEPKGILEEVAKTNKFINSDCQRNHVHFDAKSDAAVISEEASIIVIPLSCPDQPPQFLLQLGRNPPKSRFAEKEISNVYAFISKMKLYGKIFFGKETPLAKSDFIVADMTISDVCSKMKQYFKCRDAQFFCYQQKNNIYVSFDENTSTNTTDPISKEHAGFALQCIDEQIIVNSPQVGDHPNYYEKVDGPKDESALAVPYTDNSGNKWAAVLHGPNNKIPFTVLEETILSATIPFAVRALGFVFSPPQIDAQLDHFENRLKALLEVAEILSGVLDIDILLPTIMDRACKLLNAERCSLFLVDPSHHELFTRFHGGLENAIRLKIGRGIVGSCAESGEIVNIRDAYADQRFDRSVDLATGFTTRSLLCIPIYNNRGEINGVTEMINKKDEGLFDEDDEKMLMAFNVFCGISLDNARLYKASLDLTRQLRSFIQMSVAINAAETLQSTLEEIMNNIMSIVNASRVTFFLNNENDNQLYEHLSIGLPIQHGTMFAQEAVQNRKFMLFDHQEVLGHTQTQQLNKAIERILAAGLDADIMVFGADDMYEEDEEEAFEEAQDQYEGGYDQYGDDYSPEQPAYNPGNKSSMKSNKGSTKLSSTAQSAVSKSGFANASRVAGAFSMVNKGKTLKKDENTEVICCLPMFSSESTILGVIELSCNWKVMSEDIKLLDCFSVFAAVSIERSQLKDRAKFGQVDIEMKTWISERERTAKGQIPSKLLVSMDKLSQILMVKFDAPKWDGIGHIKVIYAIFDLFDLMNAFNITNEKLFHFIYEIRNTYNKVPYHNWRHAVDVTQFTTYQILTGGLDMVLTKNEIFGIIVAAICHDADHDGFSNVYNVKAETPLGILFKNQSVMETHHCSMAINIISKDECNIFSSLSSIENKNMWTFIIALILATDMAKHFDILKEFNTIMDNHSYSLDNPDHRVLLLQVLLKCSDVSNVARPFELADRWCDVLCEEFFRQGDLEKASGMEFTSALNDREHLDKPKSQIGFYQFVCLPLFQTMAKACPKLECNVEQLLSNLEQWKAATNATQDDEK
ncbi:3'5'-cyclic nucleotide phosphodiesterase family protein [Tritrichomonas foetus]|uniref:3'5'-cyclic nucleotide phosphodiesterase family protein n=1 Tax=Tritrichomonas foetus TaxID=1144522 RepID=A0A1J4J6G7_9EUKA|nr:3'5'-cyclic nucleotide phosphodiesterase family protein [Tritrichomonas foetus]|eukprot:OHS94792.1 3'5'-cyclic nucleotide phosphodiesterase family protein [Tritrichomonas foetus]